MKTVFIIAVSAAFAFPGFAQDSQINAREAVNFEEFGIQDQCIHSTRIRRTQVIDSDSVLLTMSGSKRVVMNFESSCPGIKLDSFTYISRGVGKVCAGSDTIKLTRNKVLCGIASFQPYLE